MVLCSTPSSQRWEEHLRNSQTAHPRDRTLDASLDAMQRWSRIPRRLRAALRSTDADVVARLELLLLEAMHGSQLQVSFQWDNFHRLIGHALASYHGLVSSSHDQHGQRCIAFSRQPDAVVAAVGCAEVLAVVQSGACGRGVEGLLREQTLAPAVAAVS